MHVPSRVQYQKNRCRCDGCRAKNAEFQRGYRAGRRANDNRPVRLYPLPTVWVRLRRDCGL